MAAVRRRALGVAVADQRRAGDAWAVGGEGIDDYPDDSGRPVLTRWDGTGWKRVTPTTLAAAKGELTTVAAVSPTQVWAAGRLGAAGDMLAVLRFDGASWRQVPTAGVRAHGPPELAAVPGRVWLAMAGTASVASYTGGGWTVTTLEEPHLGISAIAARTADDAWLVGNLPAGGYAAHWNGHAWTSSPLPGPGGIVDLRGVYPRSASDVWVVGTEFADVQRSLVLHWDGRAWTRVPVPLAEALLAVTGTATGEVWIAGEDLDRRDRPLLLHRAGRAWTTSYGPVPDGTHEAGVTEMAAAGETVWAAGSTGTGRAVWGHALILRRP